AQKRWAGQAVSTERQLETALGNALRSSLETHAQHLHKSEESMAEAGRQQWQQAIAALERTTAALTAQQAELQQQGRVMREAVDATGRVMQLEDALNRNLAALSGNHNFEQTLMSLSAAVNLLGARLSQPATAPRRVDLRTNRPTGNAA
ncbi:MAG: hypothetical protein K8T25_12360, partial [Planctomycetia bacterium]|nr:hypothetical protein [Planctomycetia bacterium]